MNTRNILIWVTVLTLLTFFAASPALGQANQFPPGKMTFQGFLTDASSPPVPLGNTTPENKNVTFKIYKNATGNTTADVLWAESQIVTVDKGHFSVLLGEGSSTGGLPHATDLSGVFIGADASDRWIGITVDGAEITPRIQFFAAPYAQLARVANSVGGAGGSAILTTSGSNVGIGTSSPTQKLDVNGNVTATGSVASSGSIAGLIFNDRGGSPTWQWYSDGGIARLWAGSPLGDKITVSTSGRIGAAGVDVTGSSTFSGNVGIGNTAPAFPLTFAAAVGDKISLYPAAGTSYGFGVQSSLLQIHTDASASDIAFGYGLSASMTETMRIKGNGNVGIGTSSPAQKLDVNGKITIMDSSRTYPAGLMTEVTSQLFNFGINEGTGNRFGTANTNAQGGMIRFDTRTGQPVMSIWTRPASDTSSAGGQRVAVLANGNVGIGTANPENNKLQLFGLVDTDDYATTGQHNMQFRIKNGQGTSTSRALEIGLLKGGKGVIQVNESNVGYNALLLNPVDGNVGIGTISPSSKLEVSGTLGLINGNKLDLGVGKVGRNSAAGTIGYEIYGAGALHIVGAGSGADIRNIRLWDHVGIGTDAPSVPLHIVGGVKHSFVLEGVLGDGGASDIGAQTRSDLSHSIVASQRIRAASFDVESDARIKQVTGRVLGQKSLASIRQLEVTDYVYTDKITHGERPQRGLIAQEVFQVLPEAVGQSVGVIPNIYATAISYRFDAHKKTLSVELKNPHGLEIDDVVSLIMGDSATESKVLDAPSDTSFVVSADARPHRLFVIGKRVKDFRTVDYDLVFTTGISALQELDRQVQALKKSEARIAELEQKTARMAELEQKAARVDSLEREMAEVKRLVAGLAQGQGQRDPLTAQRVSNPAGE